MMFLALQRNLVRIAAVAAAIFVSDSRDLRAEDRGASAVVVFNSRSSESESIARYYAERRAVPANQVFGLDLPLSEVVSRRSYSEQLETPLRERLEGLASDPSEASADEGAAAAGDWRERIRYAVLCYGVPVRVLDDPTLDEEGKEDLTPELRRNEAAVDSELALLPRSPEHRSLYGIQPNPVYGATNAASISAAGDDGVLMVGRLDGPSPEVARALVDRALEAERVGLWGRAYFDGQGFTNGPYALGDRWIRGAAMAARRMGVETVLDERPETFDDAFPLSHVGLYAGWRDPQASGPFAREKVEFVPGAIAYHLYSFGARSIRTDEEYWVGPLLAKGAAATMGSVAEPYLEGTPNLAAFFSRLIFFGFTFGEAAYASQSVLSWQATVVGDPLYRPFGKHPRELHAELTEWQSEWLPWSHLKIVNLNHVTDLPVESLVEYLRAQPETEGSAVLQEKLGDLYGEEDRWTDAAQAYRAALDADPSPQQQIRLHWSWIEALEQAGQAEEAFAATEEFLSSAPDYPARLKIYEKRLALAQALGRSDAETELRSQIAALKQAASNGD